jgi:hypothetical protein
MQDGRKAKARFDVAVASMSSTLHLPIVPPGSGCQWSLLPVRCRSRRRDSQRSSPCSILGMAHVCNASCPSRRISSTTPSSASSAVEASPAAYSTHCSYVAHMAESPDGHVVGLAQVLHPRKCRHCYDYIICMSQQRIGDPLCMSLLTESIRFRAGVLQGILKGK